MLNKLLSMSDEEFEKSEEYTKAYLGEMLTPPQEEETPVAEAVEQPEEEPVVAEEVEEAAPVVEEEEETPPAQEGGDVSKAPTPDKVPEPTQAGDAAQPAAQTGEGEEEKIVEEPDYKALYNQIVGPIKANGKTIEIRSAEEAIRLMQQGAGFGRKMAEIKPHVKTLKFLEQNNLLNVDQSELAFLVDLRNKNPEAIKKLIQDSGIDPLDLSVDTPVNYKSNIPAVSDQQVAFQEAIDSVKELEGGQETLTIAYNKWDSVSHDFLMANPDTLEIVHNQRTSGIYDRIVTEMERQKALGYIKHDVPFLQAYFAVGDYLRDNHGFKDLEEAATRSSQNTQVAPVVQPTVVAVRPAGAKPSVTNNAQVKGASIPKSTPRATTPLVNPLTMSDEEFLKLYGNA